jgi:hypothetical protein
MLRLNNPGLTFVRTERNISSVAAYRPTDQRCEAGRRPDIWDDAVGCLSKLGAGHVDHPGGSLLAHLIRTGDLLLDWDARPALTLAGLCHGVYGTDGFPTALRSLQQRPEIAGLVGVEAEAIVYRYASCDRRFTFPRLGREGPVAFRDRFTGEVIVTNPFRLSDFLELTFANELDLVSHSPAFGAKGGAAIADVLGRCTHHVSPSARRAFHLILGCYQ